MTIRERHENTKEKLNQLVIKARNDSSSASDESKPKLLLSSRKVDDKNKSAEFIKNMNGSLLFPMKD